MSSEPKISLGAGPRHPPVDAGHAQPSSLRANSAAERWPLVCFCGGMPHLPIADHCQALEDPELVVRILGGTVRNPEQLVGMLQERAGMMLEDVIGKRKARSLHAAVELGRRIGARERREHEPELGTPEAVYGWALERLVGLDHEELWALTVDSKNRMRSARMVAKGGAFGVVISPRDILREVLREGAPAFLLVHNHPSGDPTPSAADLAFTNVVAEAARVVSVPLLDHMIVAREGYCSIAEREGWFPPESE